MDLSKICITAFKNALHFHFEIYKMKKTLKLTSEPIFYKLVQLGLQVQYVLSMGAMNSKRNYNRRYFGTLSCAGVKFLLQKMHSKPAHETLAVHFFVKC